MEGKKKRLETSGNTTWYIGKKPGTGWWQAHAHAIPGSASPYVVKCPSIPTESAGREIIQDCMLKARASENSASSKAILLTTSISMATRGKFAVTLCRVSCPDSMLAVSVCDLPGVTGSSEKTRVSE